jgi:hypothetical protein
MRAFVAVIESCTSCISIGCLNVIKPDFPRTTMIHLKLCTTADPLALAKAAFRLLRIYHASKPRVDEKPPDPQRFYMTHFSAPL